MKFPFKGDYSRYDIYRWLARERPTLIEISDEQFSSWSILESKCFKEWDGVPLLFTDAPKQKII